MRNQLIRFALALPLAAASLALAACGEEEEAPTVIEKKADDKPVEVPLDAEKKEADLAYTYNATGRRDPFKTYFDEIGDTPDSAQTTGGKPLTELQQIDLDKLKLIAVIVGTATPMAMVEDPSGRGHTLKIGTLIGKRLGQVKHIRRAEVVVQEEFRDFTGKRIPQLKTLSLEDSAVRVQ